MVPNGERERVQVEGVSKRYCRDLKRSLWYGLRDIGRELAGREIPPNLRAGEFWSLREVSLKVNAGECVALVGPNGAGKSTLLKILGGLLKPDTGTASLRGRVASLIELGAGFHPLLTARENIAVNAAVLGLRPRDLARRFPSIVEFAGVEEFLETPVQSFSSGMRVRLGYAISAHLDPDVLLIDEVLAVGDVGFRMKCYDHLLGLLASGAAIVLVTHNMNDVARVASRVVLLDRGTVAFDGDPAEGVSRYQLLARHPIDAEATPPEGPRIGTIQLRSTAGDPTEDFHTGDTLIADVELVASTPLRGARLIAAVESPVAGVLGSFSTAYTGFQFDIVPPMTRLRLTMPNLPLLSGAYYLNFNLYGPELIDFFDRRAPGAAFRIRTADASAFGFSVNHMIRFDHRWARP